MLAVVAMLRFRTYYANHLKSSIDTIFVAPRLERSFVVHSIWMSSCLFMCVLSLMIEYFWSSLTYRKYIHQCGRFCQTRVLISKHTGKNTHFITPKYRYKKNYTSNEKDDAAYECQRSKIIQA